MREVFEKEGTDKREERKWRVMRYSLTFIVEAGESVQKLILKIKPYVIV